MHSLACIFACGIHLYKAPRFLNNFRKKLLPLTLLTHLCMMISKRYNQHLTTFLIFLETTRRCSFQAHKHLVRW